MNYGINDNDRDDLWAIRERVLGPAAEAAAARRKLLPAGSSPAIARQIGLVQLTSIASGSGATALWNWVYVQLKQANAAFNASDFGSNNIGPCRVVPYATAQAQDVGILYYVQQDDGSPMLVFVPGGDAVYDAKILSGTAINGGIRFRYQIEFGYWNLGSDASLPGTWVTLDNNGGAGYHAFNSAEDMNTFTSGTGAIGTGNTNVTQSDGTINGGSCKLVRIPDGGFVSVKNRGTDSNGVTAYTIINFANSAQ